MTAPASRATIPDPLRVEVRRIIARPVEEVFRAWTTPASIAQWLGAGNEDVRVRGEARIGGRIRVDLIYNGAPWFLDGEYLEVVPNRRLRYTWVTTECPASVGSVVTVEFRPLGSRTEVRLLHEGFPDLKTRSDHDATGWQQIMEGFAKAADGELSPDRLKAARHAILEEKRGDSYQVEVRRVIARPADEVFAAWLTPASLEKWICPGGAGARVTVDARVGGRFHIDMLGLNGEVWEHDGEYLELDSPRRLAFTWVSEGCGAPLGSVVTVDFHDLGSETEVVLVHSGFPSAKGRDDHAIGWAEILSQLAAIAKIGFSAFGIAKSMVELRKLGRN
jgi:uncharacterized protein YndB with AHSA1/START domain